MNVFLANYITKKAVYFDNKNGSSEFKCQYYSNKPVYSKQQIYILYLVLLKVEAINIAQAKNT